MSRVGRSLAIKLEVDLSFGVWDKLSLAEFLMKKCGQRPLRHRFPPFAGFLELESGAYYGAGY